MRENRHSRRWLDWLRRLFISRPTLPATIRSKPAESSAASPGIDFHLSLHPPEYYLAQFTQTRIKRVPHDDGGRFSHANGELVRDPAGRVFRPPTPAHWACELSNENMSFLLTVETENTDFDSADMQITREVLGNVCSMDDMAHPEPGHHDEYHPCLLEIIVKGQEIEFRYASTRVNTEWSSFFAREAAGKFRYKGLG